VRGDVDDEDERDADYERDERASQRVASAQRCGRHQPRGGVRAGASDTADAARVKAVAEASGRGERRERRRPDVREREEIRRGDRPDEPARDRADGRHAPASEGRSDRLGDGREIDEPVPESADRERCERGPKHERREEDGTQKRGLEAVSVELVPRDEGWCAVGVPGCDPGSEDANEVAASNERGRAPAARAGRAGKKQRATDPDRGDDPCQQRQEAADDEDAGCVGRAR